uniref:Uncharacterized protein n=1 Tax=Panagrolaimus sp. PS1159 TaxID=55785 RepID=A0AC35GKI5_9BILA
MHPQIYNTAYPMTQSAMLPSTQTAAAAANAALYGTGVGQPSGTLLNGATNAAKLADVSVVCFKIKLVSKDYFLNVKTFFTVINN